MAELVGALFLGLATWATLIALLTSLSLLVPAVYMHLIRSQRVEETHLEMPLSF